MTDDVPGLEIETEEGWLPVPPRPDCFIVNAGDQVDFWTRGFFKSANHRVWVLVKGFNLSYHNKETILFTTDPYYGNLN